MNTLEKFPSDLTGIKFYNLIVVKEANHKVRKDGKKVRQWECKCDCGKAKICNRQELVSGKRKSCGCMHSYYARVNNTEHGDSHTRLHNIWSGMRARCYNPKEYHYKWYGSRGIKMCDEWRNDYIQFKKWALENGYNDNLSIDRIDNDGHYCPENCRWVTQVEQCNNTSRNHFIEINGVVHTLAEWSKMSGIKSTTIRKRLKDGWNTKDAVYKCLRKSVDGKYPKNIGYIFEDFSQK